MEHVISVSYRIPEKSVSSACWHNSVNGTWAGDNNPCFTALFIID